MNFTFGQINMDIGAPQVDAQGHTVWETQVTSHHLNGIYDGLGEVEVEWNSTDPAPPGELRSVHAGEEYPAIHTVYFNWTMTTESLPGVTLQTMNPVIFLSEEVDEWPAPAATYTLMNEAVFEDVDNPGVPLVYWCPQGAEVLVTHPLPPCEEDTPGHYNVFGYEGDMTSIATGIYVSAGEHLRVGALGETCIASDPESDGTARDPVPETTTTGEPGDCVDANGADVFSANAWVPSAPLGALIGEINGRTFLLGENFVDVAPATGELRVGINDDSYEDNSGYVDVFVYTCPGR